MPSLLRLLVLSFCLQSVLAADPTLIPGLQPSKNSSFQIDGLKFAISHYAPDWARTATIQPATDYPKQDATSWTMQGNVKLTGQEQALAITETLTRTAEDTVRFAAKVTHPSALPTREVTLDVILPLATAAGKTFTVNGTAQTLPGDFKAVHLFDQRQAQSLVLPSPNGTITIQGNFSVHVQDNREWKGEYYVVRIGFVKMTPSPLSAEMTVDIRFQPYRCTPISLAGQCNMGFRDDVANDGKGGWTDQGPENDISMIEPGLLKAANVGFQIVDPAKNGGMSCLVLGGAAGKSFLRSAVIPLPDHPAFSNLYLLHASAWTPPVGTEIGSLVVRYQDGSEKKLPVVVDREVRNWWMPVTVSNGRVGWASENASGPVGLYVSRFRIESKPIQEIRFQGGEKWLWMIAGLSGSPDDIQFSENVSSVIAASADWAPCDLNLEIAPGGAFDFSALNDAPAGKYGPVIATPAGHFEFQNKPGVRVKFWGVNLCFSATHGLTHEEADRLAERLARSGYNTVRLHHFDRELRDPKGFSYDFVPERLERLDYLFSALKKRGIYINIDLYTSRRFKPEELATFSFGNDVRNSEILDWFKGALVLSDDALNSWKKFTENLLTHKNPHTGMTWAQDPTLIGICLVNENTITNSLRHDPRLTTVFEKAYETWAVLPANKPESGQSRDAHFNRFLLEAQKNSQSRMRDYVKSLGVHALITDVNYMDTQAQTEMREQFDYVDNHAYADHPSFPEGTAWGSSAHFRQESSVRQGARVPRVIMASRVFGKPFTVTEYDSVAVNTYRAEGSVAMPAYANLQDWDAIYRFNYASDRASALNSDRFRFFDLTSDPINLLADRVGALLFRRSDNDPAKGAVQFRVTRAVALSGMRGHWLDLPANFSFLGLVTRIGSGTEAPKAPWKLDAVVRDASDSTAVSSQDKTYRVEPDLAGRLSREGALPANLYDEAAKRFTSDNGQVELSMADGTMKVVGPRSESFVLTAGKELAGDLARVRNGTVFSTVQVIALDGKPLRKSERLLIVHLTDSLYTGMKFRDSDRRILEGTGTLPHLVRRGAATISLALDPKATWKAWAVDVTGARQEEVALREEVGRRVLAAETVDHGRVRLAYELVREKP